MSQYIVEHFGIGGHHCPVLGLPDPHLDIGQQITVKRHGRLVIGKRLFHRPSSKYPRPFKNPSRVFKVSLRRLFQFAAGNGVFVPEVFHHGDEPPLFGIEVAVELGADDIVELFQDEFAGLGLGELAADGREDGVGFGQARLERGLVLVQGGDFSSCRPLLLGIEIGQLGVHLPDQFQAFGLELVAAQAFELEFEGQFVGFCFQVGLGILDPFFNGLDRLVLGLQVFQLLAGGVACHSL